MSQPSRAIHRASTPTTSSRCGSVITISNGASTPRISRGGPWIAMIGGFILRMNRRRPEPGTARRISRPRSRAPSVAFLAAQSEQTLACARDRQRRVVVALDFGHRPGLELIDREADALDARD